MGSRRAGLALIVALAFGFAGCGDDEQDKEESRDPIEALDEIRAQDVEAREVARDLATELEICFVDNQDYRDCQAAEDVEGAEVEAATASTYTLVARSESGHEFRITRESDGTTIHECTPRGAGGCASNGAWQTP